MTLTPQWYERRGLQLNTENRYLFQRSAGVLNLSWLDDEAADEERWYRRWSHQADSSIGLRTSILLQRVSDPEFTDDFDHLDGIEEVDYLQSSLRLAASPGGWNTALLLQEYQTINQATAIASRPYKRLPRLTADRRFQRDDGQQYLNWRNEYVVFDRDDSITGERLRVVPTFSYPMEGSYYFVRPALQLDLTQYRLDNNTGDVNSIDRSLPVVSLDSGLIFERLAGSSWLQTLEPRLFLLYVPREDQADIPLFDTALLTESYRNLFIPNRFTGGDRIGDSEQASIGLTTRLLDISGRELVRASIGQAFYARDRTVSLTNSVDERDKSSLIAELAWRPTRTWQIQLGGVYDQHEKNTEQTDIAFRRRHNGHVFNLEYHMREDTLEQSTVSLVYPHSEHWSLFLKQQHSIQEDKPVQNLAGVTYDSCCWRLDLLYEEDSDINFSDTDRSVYLQLTFKGLGSAGNDINALLEDDILGYQSPY